MDNYQQFVALRCQTCGGKLDVPKQYVVDGGDGSFTIVGNDTFTCNYCDTEYLPKQSLERFVPVNIGGVTFSGIIGSTISTGPINAVVTIGGDLIGGDPGKEKSESSAKLAAPSQVATIAGGDFSSTSTKPPEAKKKWWQFWK